MQLNHLGALAAFCLSVTPLSAQAQMLDAVECGTVTDQVMTALDAEFGIEVTQSPTSFATGNMSGCGVSDLDIFVEALGVHFLAEQLQFTGNGLMDWVRGNVVLPETLDLRIDGLALDPDRAVPTDLAWLREVRADSITLSATWTERSQRLQIFPLRMDMGDGNIIFVEVDGRAVGWAPYAMPTPDFGVTELALTIDFNGLFEQAIAPPILQNGNDLSPGSMAFLAAIADGVMANAPPTLLSTEARGALVGLLRSLPTPRGYFGTSLTNETPISLERLAFDLRTGVPFTTAVPETLNIDATWFSLN